MSLSSFRLNSDQRLAQQKVNVIKNLKQAVAANRQLYGESLGNMDDIFRAMDKDGGGTVDTFEFRDGMARLGLGLSEVQIQEMIEAFDEDGNGEIEVPNMMISSTCSPFSQLCIPACCKMNILSTCRSTKSSSI
eukprot:SAG31_NODE_4172_length_3511_cov_1.676143_4_plen_134_part_00